MKLIVCNELSSAESNKSFNSDALKTLITENTIRIEQKGIPARTAENLCNFIFLSNHFDPIRISQDDRRYVMTEVSARSAGNTDYFKAMTTSKKEIKELTKSQYQLFYERYYRRFADESGWICDHAYQAYRQYAQENGFSIASKITFGKKIHEFTERKKKRIDGIPANVYVANMVVEDAPEIEDDDDTKLGFISEPDTEK